jgi:hypothetical protein
MLYNSAPNNNSSMPDRAISSSNRSSGGSSDSSTGKASSRSNFAIDRMRLEDRIDGPHMVGDKKRQNQAYARNAIMFDQLHKAFARPNA